MMCLLAGIAYPLVGFLLGEKWRFTATLIIPLSFTMMWYPIHAINLNLLQVKGRSDLFLRLEIIKKIIGVTVLVLSIPFGLLFMCYAGIVTSIICLVINTYYTGKLIQVGLLMQMKDLMGILISSLVVFAVSFLVSYYVTSNLQCVILASIVGAALFALLSYLFNNNDVKYLLTMIKK